MLCLLFWTVLVPGICRTMERDCYPFESTKMPLNCPMNYCFHIAITRYTVSWHFWGTQLNVQAPWFLILNFKKWSLSSRHHLLLQNSARSFVKEKKTQDETVCFYLSFTDCHGKNRFSVISLLADNPLS